MPADFSSLPGDIRAELQLITRSLVDQYDRTARTCASRRQRRSRIRSIILHGDALGSGDYHRHHLLVIVNRLLPAFIWPAEMAEVYLSGLKGVDRPVTLIFETQQSINAKLRDGYRFYHNIAEDGILLYQGEARGPDFLSAPEQPSAEVHYAKAKEFFDHDWTLACDFLIGAYRYQAEDKTSPAALMLHLAVEQAYLCFMRMHTLQRPFYKELSELLTLAESIQAELKLPWSGEGARCFHHLRSAFGEVRFSDHFTLDKELLATMTTRVEDLLRLIRHLCRLKLEALSNGDSGPLAQDWLDIAVDARDEQLPDRPSPPKLPQKADPPSLMDIEDPCWRLIASGDVLTSIAIGGEAADPETLSLMGTLVSENAQSIRETFRALTGHRKACENPAAQGA